MLALAILGLGSPPHQLRGAAEISAKAKGLAATWIGTPEEGYDEGYRQAVRPPDEWRRPHFVL